MILVQSIIFEHTFYQEAFNMKESSKNCVEYEVIKRASFSPKKVIETVATDVGKSQFISLRDACTCTGNCEKNMLN